MGQKNNFYFSRSGQIAVFILIAILIILLFVFLIFVNNDEKSGNLEGARNAIVLGSNQELNILKSNVDSCLEREAKKALIVAGLRGGFIYNKGEYYFVGTIPTNTYSQNLISNLGLNWNNLQSRVLVHSQAQVYTPGIDNNVFLYEHSVVLDVEKFIAKNFVDCLDFTDVNDAYDVNFTDYLGHVKRIDFAGNFLEVDSVHAKVGDTIDVDIGDFRSISGRVKRYVSNSDSFIVEFENVSFLEGLSVEEVVNLDVVNMNRSLNISVVLNTEDVSVNLNFPVRIASNDFKTSYEDSTVKVPVRFKALLEFSRELLSHKYLEEKEIDYSDSQNVVRILNHSRYFKTTELRKLIFSQKILVDEKEEKQYIYSLIDNDSRIFGKPFVLNFGYENIAPEIDFSLVDPGLVIDYSGNVLTLLSTQDDVISYDLRPYTTEAQYWDDYISYYEPITYYGPDAEFVLTEEGTLYFKPLREKVYRYNIHVTDGETTREHIIEFVTGFPDNTNNEAAIDCFMFKNYEDSVRSFPINSDFRNKVFSYTDNGGLNTIFGLVNYVPSDLYSAGDLFFAKSCVFDTSLFDVRVYDQNGNDLPFEDNEGSSRIRIPILSRDYVQQIMVSVTSSSGVEMISQPFTFTVVPSRCLGPGEGDTSLGLSCCDIAGINASVESAISSKNVNSINLLGTDVLRLGTAIYDEDVYLCLDTDASSIYDLGGFDFGSQRVWDVDSEITSLFESRLRLVCQGVYPMPEHNIDRLGESGSVLGDVIAIKSSGVRTDLDSTVPLRMDIVESASECEVCLLENSTSFGIISRMNGVNGLVFRVGEISGNSGSLEPYLGPIPGPSVVGWNSLEQDEKDDFNEMYLLCDNSWFTTDDLSSAWSVTSASVIGRGGDISMNYVSLGYCQQGDSSVCYGREGSATSVVAQDLGCSDRYLQMVGGSYVRESVAGPASWVCGTYNIFDCSSGSPVFSGTGDRFCSGSSIVCPSQSAVYSPPCS